MHTELAGQQREKQPLHFYLSSFSLWDSVFNFLQTSIVAIPIP